MYGHDESRDWRFAAGTRGEMGLGPGTDVTRRATMRDGIGRF